MQTVEFEANLGRPQAAFVIFYAPKAQPWANYSISNSERKDLIFPVCLMINRADGDIGFIGGKVDRGETLEEAARREVQEEIGHTVTADLMPLVAHDIGSITTHAFAAETTYEELRAIQKETVNAAHFGLEVCGAFLAHLIDYEKALGRGGGLCNLIKSSMALSVREELVHLLTKKDLIPRDSLEEVCQRAGYSLQDLLK